MGQGSNSAHMRKGRMPPARVRTTTLSLPSLEGAASHCLVQRRQPCGLEPAQAQAAADGLICSPIPVPPRFHTLGLCPPPNLPPENTGYKRVEELLHQGTASKQTVGDTQGNNYPGMRSYVAAETTPRTVPTPMKHHYPVLLPFFPDTIFKALHEKT